MARRQAATFSSRERDELIVSAATPRQAQRRDLVLHESHQRRDHDGQPAQDQRRDLVAQRLARAGRHDGQDVAAGQQCVDGLFLAGPERLEAENVLQDGVFLVVLTERQAHLETFRRSRRILSRRRPSLSLPSGLRRTRRVEGEHL